MIAKAKTPKGSKWRVRKCRDCPPFYRAPCSLWFTTSPEGEVSFHPSYTAACDYVAQRQAWMSAFEDADPDRVCPNGHYDCDDDDEALPVDGAVWVGSREFQWPQVNRYPEGGW